MRALGSGGLRIAAVIAVAAGFGVAAPLACLFPSYTYDLPPGAGGTGGGTLHGSSSSTMMSSSSTSGMGGMSSSTSSTAMASSSSGAPPCASRDCSDSACAASFACVPAVPMGWTGPFALFDGMGSKDPGCGTDFPTSKYTGNNGIMVPPANCNCTCLPAQGQQCEITGNAVTNQTTLPGAIDGIAVLDAPCGGGFGCYGPLLELPTWNGSCNGPNYYPAGISTCNPPPGKDCTMGTAACNQAVRVNVLQLAGGSCTANAQPPTKPPVSWGTVGEACGDAMPGTGCTGGKTCLPIPRAPFHTGMCIMQTGELQCPGGLFSQQHVFYGGATDSRTCTACGCGAAAGGSCSASVTVSMNTGGTVCSAPSVTLNPTSAAGDCVNINGNPSVGSQKATFMINTPGTCQPTAQPMGTATAINATTFCCIP